MKESADSLKKIVVLDADKAIEKMVASFAQDASVAKKLRSLKLTKAQVKGNIGLISSYQEDLGYCAHCPGLDKCDKENPLHQSDLYLDDGILRRTFGPCPLVVAKEKLYAHYVYRDFPEEWMEVTPKSLALTKRIASFFKGISDAQKDKNHPWVYFTGQVGSGRSYLAAVFANGMVSNDQSVAFMNANKRFDELKGLAITDKEGFQSKMKVLSSIPLLVIDDFGSEFKSDYIRDQIVMPLLTERSKNYLLTIFISDYSLADIQDLYSPSRTAAVMAKNMVGLIRGNIEKEIVIEKGFETHLDD